MDCIMDTQFELQYKEVAEFKLSFVFLITGNFQSCQLCDHQKAAGFMGPIWSGELSDKYTEAVYIYCNNGRRNCRHLCETKSGCETVIFQDIFRHSFEFPEAWVAHHLLAWRDW